MLEESNAFTMVCFRLIKSTNKFIYKIADYWLAALSIRNSTGSTGTLNIVEMCIPKTYNVTAHWLGSIMSSDVASNIQITLELDRCLWLRTLTLTLHWCAKNDIYNNAQTSYLLNHRRLTCRVESQWCPHVCAYPRRSPRVQVERSTH